MKTFTYIFLGIYFGSIHLLAKKESSKEEHSVKNAKGEIMCYWESPTGADDCNQGALKAYFQDSDLYDDNLNSSKLRVSAEFKKEILSNFNGKNEKVKSKQLKAYINSYCEDGLAKFEDKSFFTQEELRQLLYNSPGGIYSVRIKHKFCQADVPLDDESNSDCNENTAVPLPDWDKQYERGSLWGKDFFWQGSKRLSSIKNAHGRQVSGSFEVPDCDQLNLEHYYKWACARKYGMPKCFHKDSGGGWFNGIFGGSGGAN